MHDLSLCWSI